MVLTIHFIRGIATLLVVFYHVIPQWQRLGGTGQFGWMEVAGATIDMFFTISGFVIWVTTEARHDGVGRFLRRRLDRVVPFYWAITLFMVLTALFAPGLLPNTRLNIAHVVASFLFIPQPYPTIPDMVAPVLIPGWTLNYELPFYLLFGLCLALPHRGRLAVIWAVLVALAAAGPFVSADNTVLAFYTQPIVLNFGMGLGLGYAYSKGARLPAWLAVVLAVVGAAMLATLGLEPLPRFLRWSLPAVLIVSGLVFLEREVVLRGRKMPDNAFMRLTGDASYSIYLTHALTLPVYARFWTAAGLPSDRGLLLFALGGLAASWCAGVFCYYALEQRLRLTRQRRPVAATVTTQ